MGLAEVIMGNWKMFFLGAVLGSAFTVAIVHYNSNALGLVGGAALAAHAIDSHQSTSAVTHPITPAEDARAAQTPDNEPWGPFRTVDW
jgi:hypothetical protein